MDNTLLIAQKEIHETLKTSNFCTRGLAVSFIDDLPSTFVDKLKMNAWYMVCLTSISLLVAGEVVYVTNLLITNTSVAEFVASLHILGYGVMSISKLLTIWSKRHVFRQLVEDLVHIWPVTINTKEKSIKESSLTALRLGQFWYMFLNMFGLGFYTIVPALPHIYRWCQGLPSDIGFVWQSTYPFDKTKPIYHEFVYAFEVFAGIVAVWSMLASDLMFMTMASNISMLLRILQVNIRSLATSDIYDDGSDLPDGTEYVDCYQKIVSVIKIHKRLISYSIDLEDAFSVVNLIIVMLSSVDICCVMFNIVILEPWSEIGSKFFLGAALTQVGILCWYADDIYRTSIGVSDAVYESGWYKSNTRCRRALLLLLQRSQKPLCFTALKFSDITMSTYSSILTTSYSYFALLYTVYHN